MMDAPEPIPLYLHIAMVCAVVCILSGVLLAGLKASRTGALIRFSRNYGFGLLGIWLIYNAYYFKPSNFDWGVSLPLHVCDILGLVSAIALIRPSPFARAMLYFCAIPLASQAVITPAGIQDPQVLRFWLYWILHAGIISASIFDLVLRRYRPTGKDLVHVVIFDFTYVILITPLNLFFDWNYGYLGNSIPDSSTAIDLLGPWPARILYMIAAAVVLQTILFLPWTARNTRLAGQL